MTPGPSRRSKVAALALIPGIGSAAAGVAGAWLVLVFAAVGVLEDDATWGLAEHLLTGAVWVAGVLAGLAALAIPPLVAGGRRPLRSWGVALTAHVIAYTAAVVTIAMGEAVEADVWIMAAGVFLVGTPTVVALTAARARAAAVLSRATLLMGPFVLFAAGGDALLSVTGSETLVFAAILGLPVVAWPLLLALPDDQAAT